MEQTANETLVALPTDAGFRIYSPANPSKSYMVNGNCAAPTCTCPDFLRHHQSNPGFRCHHILAVEKQLPEPSATLEDVDPYAAEERAAIQAEASGPEGEEAPAPENRGAQMLIKRSVSPDGRIDSLSVEFSCSVERSTIGEVKARAFKTMKLQDEIVASFLKGNGRGSDQQYLGASGGNGPVSAYMLDIGGMQTRWGWRYFINVKANGQTLKLFGTRKQLADYIAAAGFPNLTRNIRQGERLNVPCRVVIRPSEDGRYQNIEQVFPDESRQSQRRFQP